ncbi:phosphoribosyltransferase [Noviherbaspirillum sedimenti]|nr:phosphoribosyltransferase family protein [Noviherbaspirillum sedimenti]
MLPFPDRLQAGQLLSRQLEKYAGRRDVIVLALPRGGVPVGYAIAASLESPLDVFLVGKLGVPGHEDMALGAVSSRGVCVLRPETIAMMDIPPDVIEATARRELREIQRRERAYRAIRPQLELKDRVVIVADDGLVTGATMLAAVRALRHEHPAQIIVAIPVGTGDSIAELRLEADAVICQEVPEWMSSIEQWYTDSAPLDDVQVMDYLQKAAQWRIPDDVGMPPPLSVSPASNASNVPMRDAP